VGLHVEGPFLNPNRRGAHDPAHLVPPDPARAAGWSAADGVRIVTLAPELTGALELTHDLVRRGIVVSAGHSAATLDDARCGFDAGIRYATHLFNAMPPLDHRAPGLAGAALLDARVTVGLIVDGHHVDPAVVDLAWRIAGPDRFSAVSDAIAALGMPPGRYRLGDADVSVDADRAARLADGRLAGGAIGLDAAVRNLRAFTRASEADVFRAVTTVPARLLGLSDRGNLEPGARADLALLSPGLDIVATLVAGEVAYAVDDRWG
jgi:N-acetylglucosamine-6-phosphate deacetylase